LSPRSTSKNENLSGVSGMSGELGSGFFRSKFPTVINTCYKLSYLFSVPFLATYVKLNVRLAISDVSGLSESIFMNFRIRITMFHVRALATAALVVLRALSVTRGGAHSVSLTSAISTQCRSLTTQSAAVIYSA